jgi:hypothetical protein
MDDDFNNKNIKNVIERLKGTPIFGMISISNNVAVIIAQIKFNKEHGIVPVFCLKTGLAFQIYLN